MEKHILALVLFLHLYFYYIYVMNYEIMKFVPTSNHVFKALSFLWSWAKTTQFFEFVKGDKLIDREVW